MRQHTTAQTVLLDRIPRDETRVDPDPRCTTFSDLLISLKPMACGCRLFGYGLRDRILMTLAVNDRPLYVAELADVLRTWHSKVDQARLRRFRELGLYQKGHPSSDDRQARRTPYEIPRAKTTLMHVRSWQPSTRQPGGPRGARSSGSVAPDGAPYRVEALHRKPRLHIKGTVRT
jgi:hypothetical protein